MVISVAMLALAMPVAAPMSSAASPPVADGNPGDWIRTNDYPVSAIRDKAEGLSVIALMVSETGTIQGCTVVESSGSDVLDDVSCLLLRERGRFKPARSPLGKPVAGIHKMRIRWQMPEQEQTEPPIRMPLVPTDLTVQFDVDDDGSVKNCAAVDGNGAAAPENPCDGLAATFFEPAPLVEGKRKARRVILHTSLTVQDR